jgi:hypothetical protein
VCQRWSSDQSRWRVKERRGPAGARIQIHNRAREPAKIQQPSKVFLRRIWARSYREVLTSQSHPTLSSLFQGSVASIRKHTPRLTSISTPLPFPPFTRLGTEKDEPKQFLRFSEEDQLTLDLLADPATVLADLVEAGVPAERALGVLREAMRKRTGEQQMLGISGRVRQLMRQGQSPQGRAGVGDDPPSLKTRRGPKVGPLPVSVNPGSAWINPGARTQCISARAARISSLVGLTA